MATVALDKMVLGRVFERMSKEHTPLFRRGIEICASSLNLQGQASMLVLQPEPDSNRASLLQYSDVMVRMFISESREGALELEYHLLRPVYADSHGKFLWASEQTLARYVSMNLAPQPDKDYNRAVVPVNKQLGERAIDKIILLHMGKLK